MPEFSMPYQREREHEEQKDGKFIKELWRPLPAKEGDSHYNNVNILLFAPGMWKIFNPTPDMQAKYRMNQAPFDPAQPIYTFFFKMPIHQVNKFTKPDGSVGFASILCPIEMNKYLMEALGQRPLFAEPVRCAFCEEEQRQWDVFNAVWESLGVDRKTLSTEGYKDVLARTPAAANARKLAKSMQTQDKYSYAIFDHDKYAKVRPLDKDEDPNAAHQIWFSPRTVHEKLCRLFDGGAKGGMAPQGLRFFENTAAGFPLIAIVKDTTECRKGNMRDTKYDAIFSNRFFQYPPEWLAYIQNVQAMVDPSDILVQLATYEEGLAYIASQKSSGNDYQAHAAAHTGMTQGMPPGMAYGVPPGMPAPGMPPQGMPMGVPGVPPLPTGANPLSPPPQAAPAPSPYQAPPPGMPPMAPPPQGMPPQAAPPGMPPMAPPPGMPPQGMPAPSYGGAPVPAQPPMTPPPQGAPPVPTAPGFGQAPPDRTPPATPPAGDGPPPRQW